LIYIDSNPIIYLLHDVQPKSNIVIDVLSNSEQVYTNLRTIEEVSYILVRVSAAKIYGARSVYKLREILSRYGLKFVEKN